MPGSLAHLLKLCSFFALLAQFDSASIFAALGRSRPRHGPTGHKTSGVPSVSAGTCQCPSQCYILVYRHTQPSVSAGACRRRTESIVSDGLPREEGGGRGEEGVAEMLIHRGGRREKTLHLMGSEEGEGRSHSVEDISSRWTSAE